MPLLPAHPPFCLLHPHPLFHLSFSTDAMHKLLMQSASVPMSHPQSALWPLCPANPPNRWRTVPLFISQPRTATSHHRPVGFCCELVRQADPICPQVAPRDRGFPVRHAIRSSTKGAAMPRARDTLRCSRSCHVSKPKNGFDSAGLRGPGSSNAGSLCKRACPEQPLPQGQWSLQTQKSQGSYNNAAARIGFSRYDGQWSRECLGSGPTSIPWPDTQYPL